MKRSEEQACFLTALSPRWVHGSPAAYATGDGEESLMFHHRIYDSMTDKAGVVCQDQQLGLADPRWTRKVVTYQETRCFTRWKYAGKFERNQPELNILLL